jgi:hypothetical protein
MNLNVAYLYGASLFRFSAKGSHFLSEIKKRELYFSKPSEFNDPFDCQLEYERVLHKDLSGFLNSASIDVNTLVDNVSSHIQNARVCCFSTARKNQLMWAHYAAKHTGICIGFDTAMIARETKCQMTGVSYMSKHPLSIKNKVRGILDELELREGLNLANDQQAVFDAVASRLLCSKYSFWRYEREVRLISQGDVKKAISPKAITSVTIGLKATKEVKEELYVALENDDWRHVKLLEAEKKPEAYALQFKEISRDYLLHANPQHP